MRQELTGHLLRGAKARSRLLKEELIVSHDVVTGELLKVQRIASVLWGWARLSPVGHKVTTQTRDRSGLEPGERRGAKGMGRG